MADVPDMWRTELWHPMIVHFPLALLSVGTVLWLSGKFLQQESRWSFVTPAARLLLFVGVLSAWAAVFTGDLANSEVARELCDPTIAESHEEYAIAVASIFTIALGIDLFAWMRLESNAVSRRLASVLVAIALVAATGLLGYVGHLGASLVYQQAAAVYRPDPACIAFE